jgi:hypothetical protein
MANIRRPSAFKALTFSDLTQPGCPVKTMAWDGLTDGDNGSVLYGAYLLGLG